MSNIQIKYQVESREELEVLENAIKKLFSAYSLNGRGTATASISLASKIQKRRYDIIDITPDKHSHIEEICSATEDRPGKTIKSSPNFQYLEIEDTSFIINYKHEINYFKQRE